MARETSGLIQSLLNPMTEKFVFNWNDKLTDIHLLRLWEIKVLHVMKIDSKSETEFQNRNLLNFHPGN